VARIVDQHHVVPARFPEEEVAEGAPDVLKGRLLRRRVGEQQDVLFRIAALRRQELIHGLGISFCRAYHLCRPAQGVTECEHFDLVHAAPPMRGRMPLPETGKVTVRGAREKNLTADSVTYAARSQEGAIERYEELDAGDREPAQAIVVGDEEIHADLRRVLAPCRRAARPATCCSASGSRNAAADYPARPAAL
jgi:hypothetical protein